MHTENHHVSSPHVRAALTALELWIETSMRLPVIHLSDQDAEKAAAWKPLCHILLSEQDHILPKVTPCNMSQDACEALPRNHQAQSAATQISSTSELNSVQNALWIQTLSSWHEQLPCKIIQQQQLGRR